MAIEKVFLDWQRPALPAVADFLAQRYQQDATLDLSRVILVLPGARAGRRLREILVSETDAKGWVFFPPEVTTVGQLPEKLYQPKRPFANDLVQKLAWAEALRSASKRGLRQLLADVPKQADDLRWLETGSLLWSLHRELASESLSFDDVIKRAREEPDFREASRWKTLVALQKRYLSILDELRLLEIVDDHTKQTNGRR